MTGFRIGNDELQEEKTEFISKVNAFMLDVAKNNVTPKIIGAPCNKGLIMCAMEDTGDPDKMQMVCSGAGTPEMLEFVAEALIQHPILGQLLTIKVTEQMIRERFTGDNNPN